MDIQELYDEHRDTIQPHYDAIHEIILESGQLPGGTTYYYYDSTEVYSDLIPKRANLFYYAQTAARVVDIGFNAGHSTLLFALANPGAEITVFDLFDQSYAQACLNYVRGAVTNTIIDISGNTLETLAPFAEQHADTFDLVHVNGGFIQDVFYNDFAAALQMVKIGGIVIVDNCIIYYISHHVDKYIMQGVLEEIQERLYINTYNHRILRRVA